MTVKTYRSIDNLKPEEKWDLLVSYIKMTESDKDIAERLGIKEKGITNFISKVYKRFQQARETKLLIATQQRPEVFQIMKTKYVDSEHINRLFLDKLSEPDSIVLSDSEILFCEFHIEYGDDIKALEKSKLNLGLTELVKNKEQYREACLLRAFYLKRKPNVANYINSCKRRSLKELENGKEFLQENLINLIAQLKNSSDPRNTPQILKALEQLGRTIGAFDDKITINNTDSDKVLDMMLVKANARLADEGDKPDLIAYVNGEEIYG